MHDAQYQTCFTGFDKCNTRRGWVTGSPRYGIRDNSTSLVTLSCEILYLKTWVKM